MSVRPIRLDLGTLSIETAFHVPALPWDRADFSGYAAPAGDPTLRQLVAQKLRERNGLDVGADDTVVTTGASGGLLAALATLVPRDGIVALPDPGYPGYRAMATLLGLRVADYSVTGDIAEAVAACVERSSPSAVVVNSPGNPSGRVLDHAAAKALTELAEKASIWLISDEVYEDFVFDGGHVSLAAVNPAAPVMSLFSLSKSFGLAGWRIGYAAAPPAHVGALSRNHWAAVMSAPGPAQVVAAAALRHGYETVAAASRVLRERRDRLCRKLRASGLDVQAPEGGIFFWIPAPDGLDGGAFAATLWKEQRVAVQGGAAFGPGGAASFRLNFGAAADDVDEAVDRISSFVSTGDFGS